MDYQKFVSEEMRKDPPKSRAEAQRKMEQIARKWRALRHGGVRPNPIRMDLGSFLFGGALGVIAAKTILKG